MRPTHIRDLIMSKITKVIVIVLLVVATFAVLLIDALMKENNGFGIPVLIKFVIIMALVGGIAKVAKIKSRKE